MAKYIVGMVAVGNFYDEIEADDEQEALRTAYNKYANKKVQLKATIQDDIDTFSVFHKVYP